MAVKERVGGVVNDRTVLRVACVRFRLGWKVNFELNKNNNDNNSSNNNGLVWGREFLSSFSFLKQCIAFAFIWETHFQVRSS